MSCCDLPSKGQVTARGAKSKELECWLVELGGQPVNVLPDPRVKTKPIAITRSQQPVSVRGVYLQEDSPKEACLCVPAEISRHQSARRGGQSLPSWRQPSSCKVPSVPTPEQASKPDPVLGPPATADRACDAAPGTEADASGETRVDWLCFHLHHPLF